MGDGSASGKTRCCWKARGGRPSVILTGFLVRGNIFPKFLPARTPPRHPSLAPSGRQASRERQRPEPGVESSVTVPDEGPRTCRRRGNVSPLPASSWSRRTFAFAVLPCSGGERDAAAG